jgi:hypothetical protein
MHSRSPCKKLLAALETVNVLNFMPQLLVLIGVDLGGRRIIKKKTSRVELTELGN